MDVNYLKQTQTILIIILFRDIYKCWYPRKVFVTRKTHVEIYKALALTVSLSYEVCP